MQLNVKAWTATIDLPPGKYDVCLYEIVDGAPSKEPLVSFQDISAGSVGSLDDSARFVLMINPTTTDELVARGKPVDMEHKMRFSMFVGQRGEYRFTHTLHLEKTVELPDKIGVGDYLLGGNGSFPSYRSPSISDARQGIFLQIKKKSLPREWTGHGTPTSSKF